MTDQDQIRQALALLVISRDPLLGAFGRYLRAAGELEKWLENGGPMDPEGAAKIAPHVRQALSALTILGGGALQIAGVAGRAAGVQAERLTN